MKATILTAAMISLLATSAMAQPKFQVIGGHIKVYDGATVEIRSVDFGRPLPFIEIATGSRVIIDGAHFEAPHF